MNTVPQAVAFSKIAFRFGAQDARMGQACLPELYFVLPSQKQAYARGHQAEAGKTLLSCSILNNFDAACPKPVVLTDAEIAAETEDYAEWCADNAYWASGAW